MNIFSINNLCTFSNYTASLFKENVLPSLNAQQKRMVIIASLAFGFLATCYAISHYWQKKSSLPIEELEQSLSLPSKEPTSKKVKNGAPNILDQQNFSKGAVVNYTANGEIKVIYPDGSYKEGTFENNKLNGQGKAYRAHSAELLEGIFKDDILIQGKLTDSHQVVREGTFKDEKLEGKGKITGPKIYKSRLGKIIEPKILKYPVQSSDEGVFQNGKIVNGKRQLALGHIYEGNFDANGFLTGTGKLIYPNKVLYEGTFKDNYMHGKGKRTDLNGTIYEGLFVNGAPSGIINVTAPDGTTSKEFFYLGSGTKITSQTTKAELYKSHVMNYRSGGYPSELAAFWIDFKMQDLVAEDIQVSWPPAGFK